MKKIALLGALALGCASLAGCSASGQYIGPFSNLTTAQKVTLVSNFVNGVCTLSAAGIAIAQVDNAILNPNAASGGSGSSTAGTLQKASALTAANCTALNGVIASVDSSTGTATAAN